MCYTRHPGGEGEYLAVSRLVSRLPATFWTSWETAILNRSKSPIWIQIWRRPDS
jgi:hypothetical protein